MIRQTVQQFGDQHGVVREHLRTGDTGLAAEPGAVDGRDLRDLGTSAAGGRYEHEPDLALEIGQMVDHLVDGCATGHGDDLRHVHHRAAADCDDTVIVERRSILDELVDHDVGGLLGAVFVDQDDVRAVRIRFEETRVDRLDAHQQILGSQLEGFGEFLDGREGMDDVRSDGKQLHRFRSFPAKAGPV